MALLQKNFDAFGVKYRTKQFPAILGFKILDKSGELEPEEVLCQTEVLIGNDHWVPLDSRININLFVIDMAGAISPLMVLRGVMSVVNEINFGFLTSWKGIKIPVRFVEEGKSVSTPHTKPIIAHLISSKLATMKELEEYYSIKNAFDMFDIMTAKSVNEALSNEAASKKR